MADLFSRGLLESLAGVEDADAYQPRHLPASQIQKESGGRQFDKNGKPLVGRYPNGKTPPKGQEAYGIGQIQIGTARNTAKRHGIPWDEKALLTDADYNLRLSDLHKGDLIAKYGDERIAQAAYYSGEPTVDRAIARFGRAGFEQGLGPLGRRYIAGVGGSGGARVAGRGSAAASSVTRAPDISQTQATFEEKLAMAGDSPASQIVNAFTESPERIAAAYEGTRETASTADQVLQAALASADQVRQEQIGALRVAVDAKRGINDHQRQNTQALIERARPIFQKRQAIADRAVEIANMNPLEAAIKGIFNPNYSRQYLRGTDRALTNQLETLNAAYDQDFKLHQTLASLSAADFEGQNALFQAQIEDHSEDVRAAVLSYESQSRILSTELQGLQNNSALVQAQEIARAEAMDGLSDGQLNEAIARTDAGSGEVTVNGAVLKKQQLLELRQKRQNLAIDLEQRALAIEAQRLNLADAAEERVLENMNRQQLEKAIADGGQFNGQQFDVVRLGARLQQLQGVVANQVQTQMMRDSTSVAGTMLRGIADQTGAYMHRMIGAFGKTTPEFDSFSMNMTATLRRYTEGLKTATANGTATEYMAANMPMIQGLIEQQDKVVDASVKRWAGGNTHAYNVGRAWIKGESLDSGAAMRGLIHFARNGLPAGLQMTGPSARVFKVVQEEIRKPGLEKGSQTEKDNELIQRIQGRVASTYNSNVLNNVIQRMPTIAKSIKVDGKPHPFSKIPQADWIQAVQIGDEEGRKRTAASMNVSLDGFKDIIKNKEASPFWKQIQLQLKPGEQTVAHWMRINQANQTRATMEQLDLNRDEYGFRPSQAWRDLMLNPQFSEAAGNEMKINERGSFGGFISSMAAAGGVHTAFQNYADGIVGAYSERVNNIRSLKQLRAEELKWNVDKRTQFILGAIDGFSQADENLLLAYIRQNVTGVAGAAEYTLSNTLGRVPNLLPFGQDAPPLSATLNQQIDQWIVSGKSNDPKIEQLRKHAARQWGQIAPVVGKALDRHAERD